MSIMILTASGMLFSAIYSIWLFNRVCFGNLKIQYINKYRDMTRREFFYVFPLAFLTIALGIAPDIILSFTYLSVKGWFNFI